MFLELYSLRLPNNKDIIKLANFEQKEEIISLRLRKNSENSPLLAQRPHVASNK